MLQNMARWADKTPLISFEAWGNNLDKSPIKNLAGPRSAAKNDARIRLNADDLRDPIAFNDLYYTWLGFCAICWRKIETKGIEYKGNDAIRKIDEDYKYYLPDGATDQEREAYLNDKIKSVFMGLSHDQQKYAEIREAVRKHMQGIPFYMQLRVIAACLFTHRMPDALFSQGGNWLDPFRDMLPHEEDDLKVEDGQTLEMDFTSPLPEPLRLWPRSLYNDSDQAIALKIRWNRGDYVVHLPPRGKLRALFADEKCERLLGLKGNIAFNADGRTATAQLYGSEKPGTTIVAVIAGGRPYTLEVADVIDAFPVNTGFGVLRAHDIRDNNGKPLEGTAANGDLPVRWYAAGDCWARLYRDGTLVYGDANGERGSAAVVGAAEVDGAAICFYTRDAEYFSWSRGICRSLGFGRQDLFFGRMMNRFLKEGRCESATGSRMALEIDLQGRLLNGQNVLWTQEQ